MNDKMHQKKTGDKGKISKYSIEPFPRCENCKVTTAGTKNQWTACCDRRSIPRIYGSGYVKVREGLCRLRWHFDFFRGKWNWSFKYLVWRKRDYWNSLNILNLGMLDSLLDGAVTFEDAYNYLYRPYVAQLLNDNEANKPIECRMNQAACLERT